MAASEGVARLNRPDDASIGIGTCGWYEGTAVTCTSSATCVFSSICACCIDHACSSSAFNTACLPYDDPACLPGTMGPATKCCTDAASPACLALLWPTTPGAPDLTVFTMLDSCVPASQAGQGVLAATSPPPPPRLSPSHPPATEASFLKPPAGAILECILGAAAVSAVVVIGCVIVIRKMHESRALARLRAGAEPSSLTVATTLSGQGGPEPGIPLSTARPGAVRAAAREGKADGRHEDGRRGGLETSRE